jgi:hypothetical protein
MLVEVSGWWVELWWWENSGVVSPGLEIVGSVISKQNRLCRGIHEAYGWEDEAQGTHRGCVAANIMGCYE